MTKAMAEKLRNAANSIEAVTADLDISGEACPCCEIMRRKNFNEYQMSVELNAVVRKLRMWADRMVRE